MSNNMMSIDIQMAMKKPNMPLNLGAPLDSKLMYDIHEDHNNNLFNLHRQLHALTGDDRSFIEDLTVNEVQLKDITTPKSFSS